MRRVWAIECVWEGSLPRKDTAASCPLPNASIHLGSSSLSLIINQYILSKVLSWVLGAHLTNSKTQDRGSWELLIAAELEVGGWSGRPTICNWHLKCSLVGLNPWVVGSVLTPASVKSKLSYMIPGWYWRIGPFCDQVYCENIKEEKKDFPIKMIFCFPQSLLIWRKIQPTEHRPITASQATKSPLFNSLLSLKMNSHLFLHWL